MKKKNLTSLILNKESISKLANEKVKGGSNFPTGITNCYTPNSLAYCDSDLCYTQQFDCNSILEATDCHVF